MKDEQVFFLKYKSLSFDFKQNLVLGAATSFYQSRMSYEMIKL